MCICHRCWGRLHWNLTKIFGARKLESPGYYAVYQYNITSHLQVNKHFQLECSTLRPLQSLSLHVVNKY